MTDSFWYPSVQDVLAIHEAIVSEYDATSAGIQDEGDIEFALAYIADGNFGTVPETIHEKAFHLLRLLVANHPFVDGNKRTALNTTVVFYLLNGYRFDYDPEIRRILKRFGHNEASVREEAVIRYLRTHTTRIDVADELGHWQDTLVEYGVQELLDDESNPNDYPVEHVLLRMAAEEDQSTDSPLDDVMADIRREIVLRVAKADRDDHREIYDALEDE